MLAAGLPGPKCPLTDHKCPGKILNSASFNLKGTFRGPGRAEGLLIGLSSKVRRGGMSEGLAVAAFGVAQEMQTCP